MNCSTSLCIAMSYAIVCVQGTVASAQALEPKDVVVAFYSSLADEDSKRASQLVLKPKKMTEWIKSQTDLSATFKNWNKAVAAKLGEDGAAIILPNPIQQVADRSQQVDARVKGSEAEFPINNRSPLKLRRVAGKWKLDIFSAYEKPETLRLLGVDSGDVALKLVTIKAQEQAKMLGAVIAEINAGRLTTTDQVRQQLKTERDSMNNRVLQAMAKAKRKGSGEPE